MKEVEDDPTYSEEQRQLHSGYDLKTEQQESLELTKSKRSLSAGCKDQTDH